MPPIFTALAAFLLAWETPGDIALHPERYSPAPGAVLAAAPRAVSIVFDNDMQPSLSRLLVEYGGQIVGAGRGVSRRELAVELDRTGGGAYTVSWKAVGLNGHETRSSFQFQVQGSSTPAQPARPPRRRR